MYDFETILDREGSVAFDVPNNNISSFVGEVKVKEGFSLIPMWIADMGFKSAPSVSASMLKRMENPAFGYFDLSNEYFKCIIDWHKRMYDQDINKEDIGYENGVLGGISTALKAYQPTNNKILVQSPCYIGFTNVLKDNNYEIIYNPMYKDEENIWRIDYDLLEKQIVENKIETAIFNNPQNPSGRVFTFEELDRVAKIYEKYDVKVISDEIWADIIRTDKKHIPFVSVSEDAKMRTISLYAPSKTFNLAGLIGSYHLIFNPEVKDRVKAISKATHYNNPNILSMHALIGAFSEDGNKWLNELREVIQENVDYAYDYILNNFEGVTLSKPEGTYMLYLDVKEYCTKKQISLIDLIKKGFEVGVIWQNGEAFIKEYTIRMNLALPKSLLCEALKRLNDYVFNA